MYFLYIYPTLPTQSNVRYNYITISFDLHLEIYKSSCEIVAFIVVLSGRCSLPATLCTVPYISLEVKCTGKAIALYTRICRHYVFMYTFCIYIIQFAREYLEGYVDTVIVYRSPTPFWL